MIIVFTPAGGEPEQYDARTLLSSEASIVARTIDLKWPAVKEGLADEDLEAMRAVVWVLKKRHQANLRFGDFDPGVDEMVTRHDKTELESWVDNAFEVLAAEPEMTPERIAHALRKAPEASVDPEHARAYIAKVTAEAEGKGRAPAEADPEAVPELTTSSTETSAISEPSTSDSSPTS
ncbi:hypothetical protein [Streptomyces sp. NPDC048445]|uniref:hypothetical protein n=1 Tax=Streptomyces sp. NPDC048445 TaxID=3365553 RepID=UPI0037141615